MKVTKDTSLWDIHDYTYMKNVIITFKDGHKKKYFILDTTPAEDEPESGKDEIVYMTLNASSKKFLNYVKNRFK